MFTYKDISLSRVLQPGPTSITTYSGLQTTPVPASENSSLPYQTKYEVNGVDIANSYIAGYSDYTNTLNVTYTVPTGATHMRIIAIGGGGSGGGGGGGATANSKDASKAQPNYQGQTCNSSGGNGSPGSTGSYVTTPDILLINNSLQLTVGTGGPIGTVGQSTSNSSAGGDNAQGNNGFTYSGNNTVIIYNGVTYNAVGGLGGGIGNGADANVSSGGNQSDSPGVSSAPTNLQQTSTTPSTWPSLQSALLQYGRGGTGGAGASSGNNAGQPGTAGQNGYARIIWLYQ